jgi:hypothetical protein
MSDVKKKLLEEIDRKIAKKKAIRAQSQEKNTYEAYILEFIKDMEDLSLGKIEGDTWLVMMQISLARLEEQMKKVDWGCKIEISWHTIEGKDPQVNGVLIKWSPYYQMKNSVYPELFVDVASLLLK